MPIHVRPFDCDDSARTLDVYLRAIRVTAAADYTPEQVAAWAPSDFEPDQWLNRRTQRNTAVAVVDGVVVGFTDVSESGYIDMLFVDPNFGRLGVATALLQWVRSQADGFSVTTLTTQASITGRSFFEKNGFLVDEECHPVIDGVALTNYAMTWRRDRGLFS